MHAIPDGTAGLRTFKAECYFVLVVFGPSHGFGQRQRHDAIDTEMRTMFPEHVVPLRAQRSKLRSTRGVHHVAAMEITRSDGHEATQEEEEEKDWGTVQPRRHAALRV